MAEKEPTNGEPKNLTKRERLWLINFPNGYDIPGSLKLADDYINTLHPKAKILEVGCGIGRVIGHLVRHKNVDATGIDINRAAIKRSKEQRGCENAKFAVMDGTELKFPDNSFDNVIMTGVIGGVELEIREKLLTKAYRAVKPGGTVAVAEFKMNLDDPEKVKKYKDAEQTTHERGTRIIKRGDKELIVKHFNEDELIKLLTDAGFVSIQTRGESIETAGIGDGIVEARRQYTVWGTKPKEKLIKRIYHKAIGH